MAVLKQTNITGTMCKYCDFRYDHHLPHHRSRETAALLFYFSWIDIQQQCLRRLVYTELIVTPLAMEGQPRCC